MKTTTNWATVTYAGDPFFARLAEASTIMIWLLDADGAVIHANLPARQSSLPGNLENGAQWRDIWPQTSRLYVTRALDEALSGQAVAFRLRCPLNDNAMVYLDITIGPIRDDAERLVRLLVRAEDVTAQVESSAFLHTVIETLPSALTVRDARTGRYILANRAAEALFDCPQGLIGLTGEEILPPAFAAWEAEEEPLPNRMRSTFHAGTASCSDRHISAVKVATYDDDGVRHVISLTEDVTRQRRDEAALREALEKARQAERARNTFLSNISHELRTPLNGVIAGIDLIESGAGDRAEVLEMVRRSAATLERRLEDLMRVVHLDAPSGQADIEPIDAAVLLQDLAARFRARADAKGLTLVVENHSAAVLAGNRVCLEEALSRLIDNAIKFSGEGRIVLRAETLADGRFRFSVIDDGIGFDPTKKDLLFNNFEQGDGSLTRRFDGLGLGLTIAREAAKKLGGVIDAAARPEGGACFWLDAPLAAASPEPSEPDIGAQNRLRVLIADDHPTNRRIVELMMEGLAEVTSVEDGLEAVEAAAGDPFDVILMDIQMPRLDGISAVARIRAAERASGRAPTPVIMLTANTQAEHLEASRAVGADRHIGKPFTAGVLLNGIQGVLNAAP
ncbi:hybrid sensor histidine kinase/response regulator [Brevundimonas sp. 2YAF1]|uniref:hybrid sensor histidine kinase/response regulator n=1 Tax=Brevundimonas sp. 2YAF1 TaxID=3233024 RepID=UPI003F93C209